MRARWIRGALAVAILLGAELAAPGAGAAEPKPAELAAARKHFDEALELEKAERWSEAEPKLREALAVKETPGLRYHIGLCLEHLGKLVEALVEYDRADEMLRLGAKAPDVAKLLVTAREGVDQRVARLTLRLATEVDGVEVELDHRAVRPALLGQPLPQNPGKHVVAASAPGHQSFRRELVLGEAQAATLVVELPELVRSVPPTTKSARQPAASPAASPAPDASSEPRGSLRTPVLIGEAAFTVLALGAGVLFAIKTGGDSDDIAAAQKDVDALTGGGSGGCSSPQPAARGPCARLSDAVSSHEDHAKLETLGFVAAGVGAAATVTTFLLWKPEAKRAGALRFVPVGGSDRFGVSAFGRF